MNGASLVELLRKQAIEALFQSSSVSQNWPVWGREIRKIIGPEPSAQSILEIGDHLREVFQKTGVSGRSQGDLSSGGTGWETLVCWYINLCCAGTRVVAIRKKSLLPKPILDAITVKYANAACSSESDITVLVFPDIAEYTQDDPSWLTRGGKIVAGRLQTSVENNFAAFEVGIIQCKTNWNDNAQVPMLWDIIYTSGGIPSKQITVGQNNFSIKNVPFTYSFVTAPTNQLDNFKNTSTCVGRVRKLSGGNYWGLPSKNGVANSLKEIFTNYQSGLPVSGIRQSIACIIPLLQTDLAYFQI